MRVADRALPPITLDDVSMLDDWPIRPVIALDTGEVRSRWDATPAAKWDAAGVVWDGGWADATCAWTGCEIDFGEPDEAALFPSARCVVQLDNADGAWSALNADGTAGIYGPGTALAVWAHQPGDITRTFGDGKFGDEVFGAGGGDWWLFHGRIARYDQRADDTVEVEAFDAFSDLAQPIGTYTPGANGQKLGARLTAVLAASGQSIPTRFATGIVNMTAQVTERTPLEEMQTVVLSDGAILFMDSDGTLVAMDRTWPGGRDDQVEIPIASDNVCTAPIVVWDAVISINDESLADQVVLENVAGLRSTAGVAGDYVIALTEQQWTTQAEGDGLANEYLVQQSDRNLSVEEFALYLNDPLQPEIWRAVDWRRLDHLRILHDQKVVGGTIMRVDVTTIVDAILHEITPEGWTMTISTAKARDFTVPIFYDDGHLYDETPTPEEYGF